jgi:hypothetical protein
MSVRHRLNVSDPDCKASYSEAVCYCLLPDSMLQWIMLSMFFTWCDTVNCDIDLSLTTDCPSMFIWLPPVPCLLGCKQFMLCFYLQIGDARSKRIDTRFDSNFTRAFTMLTMLLPGTPICYYGDEINMADSTITTGVTPSSREQVMRTPMQWDNSSHAGFSEATPWMAVNAGYEEINVEVCSGTVGCIVDIYADF